MGSWFDSVTITDEVAFSTDPLAASPSWTDITDYVLEFSSFVGRQDEWSKPAPGRATLVLDNADRRFDPEYTSGTYYPNVLPMRKFRRTVTYSGTTYDVFTGFILGWPQQWQQFDGTVTVEVVDASIVLENETLPVSSYRLEMESDSPLVYAPLQSDIGAQDASDNTRRVVREATIGAGSGLYPLGDATGTVGAGTPAVWEPTTSRVFAIECWAVFDDASFTIEACNGNQGTSSSRLSVTYDGSSLEVSGYPELNEIDPNDVPVATWKDGEAHHLRVEYDSTGTEVLVRIDDLAVDVIDVTGATVVAYENQGLWVSLASGSSSQVSHVAFYAEGSVPSDTRWSAHYTAGTSTYVEYSGDRIGRVLDDIGFPAADRDIDTGNTIHAAYLPAGQRALDYIDAVVTAEQGLIHFGGNGDVIFRSRETLANLTSSVTFSDDATDLAGSAIEYVAGDMLGASIDTVRNLVTATTWNGNQARARNAASRTAHLTQSEDLETPTLPNWRAAKSLARYVVRERKNPRQVFPSLIVELRPDVATKVPAMLGLAIGDAVTVRRTPYGLGNEIEQTAVVLGIGHENRGAEAQWRVTVYLAPAPTQTTDATTPLLTASAGSNGEIGAAPTYAGNIIIA